MKTRSVAFTSSEPRYSSALRMLASVAGWLVRGGSGGVCGGGEALDAPFRDAHSFVEKQPLDGVDVVDAAAKRLDAVGVDTDEQDVVRRNGLSRLVHGLLRVNMVGMSSAKSRMSGCSKR